ncbi:TPA: hypothetical protein H2U99_003283, partial [Salmonella enterica]|nr:hypothetical protein [Salmonella enterica]
PYLTHGQFAVKWSFKNIMRLTKVYFKRTNRLFIMLSFLALGVSAGMFWQSNHHDKQASVTVSQRVKNASGKTLPELFISSFSQYGGEFSYQLSDGKQGLYNPSDLIANGYEITVFSPCRIVIKRDSYLQVVTCK